MMIKRAFSALIAMAFFAFPPTAVAVNNASESDAFRVNNYEVKVGHFNKLSVLDNADVIYRCNPDSTGYVAWTGQARFDDAFIFTVKNGKLTIQVNTDDVGEPDLPVIVAYSDYLTEVVNSGEKSVHVYDPAPTSKFKAEVIGNGSLSVRGINATEVNGMLNTGNGTVALSGKCTKATLKMVGTGSIQADELRAEIVRCKILGGGTIGCYPLELLKTSGVGSTKIYYKGNPDVKKSGGGKLFRIQTAEEPSLPPLKEREIPDSED